MENGLPSDDSLMLRVASDCEVAFDQLAHRWSSKISHHCRRMICDQHTAEDLTQEVLLKLWKFRRGFQGKSSFSTYLWRITHNTCIDRLRATKRNVASDQLDHLQSQSPGPEHRIMRSEAGSLLTKALASLSENQRTVLLLKHYEGLKFREIAEILEIPEGTACSRMAEALNRLQKYFGNVDRNDLL